MVEDKVDVVVVVVVAAEARDDSMVEAGAKADLAALVGAKVTGEFAVKAEAKVDLAVPDGKAECDFAFRALATLLPLIARALIPGGSCGLVSCAPAHGGKRENNEGNNKRKSSE
ncbi:hypothetical protein [Sodalis sp. dw_96]|uniref:hypothetical protein n=1 Tax=Sodalis sp. dw_96 TaxID=2719794 RepID=UPI001BD6508F|nr:hypothetical protein [Sodalis sp. dw_96]